MTKYYLYEIINTKTNKNYIGVTSNFNRRMSEHFSKSSNSAINSDLSIYGEKVFKTHILCVGLKDYIYDLEHKYLAKHLCKDSMYNKNTGGSSNGGTFGENHGLAKITEADVLSIRRMYSEDNNLSHKKLGVQFGVSAATIGKIIRHELWNHIQEYPYESNKTTGRKGLERDSICYEDAVLIRELYSTGKYTYQDISTLLDSVISKTAVGKIIRGERWK